MSRLVVVLGYSNGARPGLHPICAARLARAAELSTADDVVVLSGWSRVPVARSEAELMGAAWTGAAREVVVDPVARTTVENAANALDDVARAGAREIVVVTSSWHAARALAAFRWLLRGRGVRVTSASPPGRSLRASLRELALWPLLPVQLLIARGLSPKGTVPTNATSRGQSQLRETVPRLSRGTEPRLSRPRRGSAASPASAGHPNDARARRASRP